MARRIKVHTKHNGILKSQFVLRQGDKDLSIYLEVAKPTEPSEEKLEFIPTNGTNKITVHLADLRSVTAIDHSSVHESGHSHTRLKPRSNGKISLPQGIPLTNLQTVKYLWTLVLRDFELSREVKIKTPNDLVIEQPDGLNNMVIDILAVPKKDLSFNYGESLNNDMPVNMNITFNVAEFEGFNVILFARGTDQFKESPSQTVKLSGQDDWVPFIKSIAKNEIKIEAHHINFGNIIKLRQ